MIEERYVLATDRINEILDSKCSEIEDITVKDYFHSLFIWIKLADEARRLVHTGEMNKKSLEEKKEWNKKLYEELTDRYEESYLNPSYACKKLGDDYGRILSCIYAEMRSMSAYAYEDDLKNILIRMELAVQIYGLFADKENEATYDSLKNCYESFAFDYLDAFMDEGVSALVCTDNGVVDSIIANADLTDLSYLYDYGEYISENELRLAEYMNGLSQDKIDSMARTYTEGYRMGFVTLNKDITIKDTVEVRYFIGFERVVRAAVKMFLEMGLKASIRRCAVSFVTGRNSDKVGYFSTSPCRQFDADHEYDKALFFSKRYMERKLESYRNAFERYKDQAALMGGPAVIECFGEEPFCPVVKKEAIKPDEDTRKRFAEYSVRAGEITNKYIKGEERSFTIIAFPVPAIGDRFEEIFDETIKINTLDYVLYRDMQQKIIDVLDSAKEVHVLGRDGNKTDIHVKLWELKDPAKETAFENCVADVNIPVGEVFTSPVLEGTHGRLHVKNVFLEGHPYKDLSLVFEDGMVKEYTCSNYENEEENRNYIKEYILDNHETLPIGEFAIGTNTVAYAATRKYDLGSVMPILIAEKTGPHFAVGDTCYSYDEDMETFNPDGKKIVARENSVSALRNTDPLKAYFNCHTDITIPYDELGYIRAIREDGSFTDIIKDGRFVLEGLEKLNEPLEEL